jgi:hypothetical protein
MTEALERATHFHNQENEGLEMAIRSHDHEMADHIPVRDLQDPHEGAMTATVRWKVCDEAARAIRPSQSH